MTILTSGILAFFAKGFTIGQFFHALPYNWSWSIGIGTNNSSNKREGGRPEIVSPRSSAFLQWLLSLLVSFLYYLYLFWRCIQINFGYEDEGGNKASISISERIHILFVLAFYSCATSIQLTVIFRREEIPTFVRNMLGFYAAFDKSTINGVKLEGSPQSIKQCYYILVFIFCMMSLDATFVLPLSILTPDSPQFISSLFWTQSRNRNTNNILAMLLSFLIQSYIQYIFMSNTILIGTTCFGFPSTAMIVLHELKSKSPRISHESILLYNQMEIILKEFNVAFQGLVACGKMQVLLFVVFGSYGAIKFNEDSNSHNMILRLGLGYIALAGTLFLILWFSLFSGFYKISSSILKQWTTTANENSNIQNKVGQRHSNMLVVKRNKYHKHKIDRLYLEKYLKSMRPLRAYVGGFYFIDKFMVLNVIRIIFESTTQILLTYP